MTTDEDAGPDVPRYSFKPSLTGAPNEFALHADGLEMQSGRRNVRIAYRDMRHVRLAFRPVTMLNYRFVMEIWGGSGPKVTIASASYRSMVELTRQDAPYREFIAELHQRIVASGARVDFRAGAPAFLYWPGLMILTALLLTTCVLVFRAVELGEWRGAAVVLAMLAFFVWQAGAFLYRNRPQTYTPDRLPDRVMP